jgi:AcrR family transcriptional regulator
MTRRRLGSLKTSRSARAPRAGRAAPVGKTRARKAAGAEPAPDRRAELLQIAARQFAEYGYEATTMRSIAEEARILPGSIYHHFATKDDMLHEVIRSSSRRMAEKARRIAEMDADPETRLASLVVLAIWAAHSEQKAQVILYNDRRFFRRSPQFAYVGEDKAAIYAQWKRVVEAGVAAGQFRADIDLFLTLTSTIRLLSTTADWFLSTANPYTLEQLTDFLLTYVLGAVRAPARAAAPLPRWSTSELA